MVRYDSLNVLHIWLDPIKNCVDVLSPILMGDKVSKFHASKHCAKNNMNVALVLLLRRARQKHRVKTVASSKTQKSDGSEC